jgi:uncharacterized protein YecT (DUF1311 family)
VIAIILVAALNCGASPTQLDLDECAAAAQTQANAIELAAFRTAMQRYHDNAALHLSEVRWTEARAAACAFDSAMVAGGSIQPMIEAQCYAASAQARVRDIALFTGTASTASTAPAVAAEHDRVYGLLELLVTSQQRELLADSERAWLDYRNAACSRARESCASALTRTRTQQLKDSWMADPFWKS